jgi:hypothetical protein
MAQAKAKADAEAKKLSGMFKETLKVTPKAAALSPEQEAVAKIKDGDALCEDGKDAEAMVMFRAALVRFPVPNAPADGSSTPRDTHLIPARRCRARAVRARARARARAQAGN